MASVRRSLRKLFSWGGWTKVAAIATALTAVAALWFSAKSLGSTEKQYELTQQGQVTERFTKASEQLGSDKLDVRLGGIYSLERLARDSKGDYPTIMEVLGAYVRGHAPAPPLDMGSSPEPRPGGPVPVRCGGNEPPPNDVPIDIQAIVTVIGRRDQGAAEHYVIDMSESCLAGLALHHEAKHLSAVNLTRTDLRQAFLMDVDLRGSSLALANLSSATLSGANLAGAIVSIATLASVDLSFADLSDAEFYGSNLTGADLTGADFSGAELDKAWLRNAKLSGADLSDATLTGASLEGVFYDSSTKWPNGFTPPPSS